MMCDITVFENLLSRPSTRNQEAGTLTISIQGTDFENLLYIGARKRHLRVITTGWLKQRNKTPLKIWARVDGA